MSSGFYIGHSTVAIDAKGRTNLPREFRKELPTVAEGRIVAVPGPFETLHIFDFPAFQRLLGSLQQLPRTPELAGHIRRLTASAAMSTLDEQNRITLPPHLIAYARLEGRATFMGESDRITLMRPERFESDVMGAAATADFDNFLATLQVPPPSPTA